MNKYFVDGREEKEQVQSANSLPVSFGLTFLLVTFLATLAIAPFLITVALVLLSVWALTGVRQSVQAISLSVIIKFLNPGLYDFPSETGVLAWLVVICASMRLLATVNMSHAKILSPFLMFGAVVAALAFISSPNITVSLMKLLSFTVISTAIIVGMKSADEELVGSWVVWFFSLAVAVILLSLVTFKFPEIGYYRNGSGFQGILNHPQVFGTWLSPILVWLFFSLLQEKSRISAILVVIIFVIFMLIILSETRTAMASVILSILLTLWVSIVSIRRIRFSLSKLRIALLTILGFFTIGFGLVFSDRLYVEIQDYVLKRSEKNIEASFYYSRGIGIEQQWNNFLDKPLTGNGFGVYPSGYLPPNAATFLGIPISAPVEKGFLPTALLEEVGLIGAVLFIWLLYMLFLHVKESGDVRYISMFFACLFINVGEAVFFSVGGVGLYYWLLIGICIASNNQRSNPASVNT